MYRWSLSWYVTGKLPVVRRTACPALIYFNSEKKWMIVWLSAVETSCFTCIDRVELIRNGQAARCTPDSSTGTMIYDSIDTNIR